MNMVVPRHCAQRHKGPVDSRELACEVFRAHPAKYKREQWKNGCIGECASQADEQGRPVFGVRVEETKPADEAVYLATILACRALSTLCTDRKISFTRFRHSFGKRCALAASAVSPVSDAPADILKNLTDCTSCMQHLILVHNHGKVMALWTCACK
jgi:hypothetical protein